MLINELHLKVVLLLPVISAELLPETKGISECKAYEESSNFKINTFPRSRKPRQAQNFFHRPSGYSASQSNKLNTHGIAISGNVGIGVRYASGNNYNGGGQTQQNHQESSSNIFDRYLGTNFNIGTNLHLATDEKNQAQQHEGSVHIPKDEDSMKRLTSDNSTTRQNTLWSRLSNYFSRSKNSDVLNGTIVDCGNEEFENCTEAATNTVLTRLFGRYLTKNEPRKILTENETVPEINSFVQRRILSELDGNHTDSFFNRVSKYFNRYKFPSIIEQIWNDRNNIDPNHNDTLSIKNDYDGFRSTVKEFLVDKISFYISQNTTNENFFRKTIKKSLSQIVNGAEIPETKEQLSIERNTLMKHLSEYFNNERFKNFFPDIETIRNNLSGPHWFDESGFMNGWLKNNLPNFKNKYFS